MGRYSSYPTTIESCKTINISNLKKWGYFSQGYKKAIIKWSVNGVETSTIGVMVYFNEVEKSILLDYKINDIEYSYKVNFVSKTSNLGNGLIWYFCCPKTKKLCRKLYFNRGLFLHREAFKDLYYSKQLESKRYRSLSKEFGSSFVPDEVYNELYSDYFKTHYRGKPTKRYLRLKRIIEKSNNVDFKKLNEMLSM